MNKQYVVVGGGDGKIQIVDVKVHIHSGSSIECKTFALNVHCEFSICPSTIQYHEYSALHYTSVGE